MYKEEKRFEFQEYCFLDDNLQLPEDMLFKNINYPYAYILKPASSEHFKCKKNSQKVTKDFADILSSQFSR